ncbi:Cation-independent mannose-6-phosphate receptor CI-MPR [Coemansia sp. RSA 1972]|nr:Cation-independent mannose-6-phosphate receptor CI-MPR [Coemansia sp. RSA 1972]
MATDSSQLSSVAKDKLKYSVDYFGIPDYYEDVPGTVRYDLRPLQRHCSYNVDGYDTDYTFNLGICNSPTDTQEPSTAVGQWFHGAHNGTFGSLNATPQLRGDKLILEYTGDDTCTEAPQHNQSALVSLICDHNAEGGPEFVAEWAHCAFMFEWRTPAACGTRLLADGQTADSGIENADQSDGVSRSSVAFVVLFVVGSIYILGGFLYNRVLNTSSRLRGFEQLPNYRFWRGIYMGGKWMVTGVANGAYYLADVVSGRRGTIRIDDAEYNFRNELFHSDDESQEILPIRQRT